MSENFVIDLSSSVDTAGMVRDISNAFESPDAKDKEIVINLKDFQLNESQMLSIKSLIMSYDSILYGVQTTSLITKQLCEKMGIRVISKDVADEIAKSIEEKKEQIANGTVEEEKITEENKNDENLDIIYGKQNEDVKVEFYSFEDAGNFKERFKEQEEISSNNESDNKEDEVIEENIVEKNNEEASNDDDMAVYTKAYNEDEEDEVIEEITYNPPTDEPVFADKCNTLYVHQTLRSGQTVEYDGHVVIIGDCHPGSEIKATGDITVWGVLGSIAHAGIKGDREAKIRALKMNAVQLRIADCYSRRPDGSNIPYIVKSSTFTPEEARIVDSGIVLYKIYQKES